MRNAENYSWYCMVDPGTSGSAFAVLFAAVDIYKPFVFYLDEIYETDVDKTVTTHTGPLIVKKCYELNENPETWRCFYDSAGAWFAAHFRKSYAEESGLRFAAVEKKPGEKEDGLDTLNALIINNSIAISQRCGNTIWEYDNYCRDKNGKLPKRNDHNIDNGRYLVKTAGIIAGLSTLEPNTVGRRRAKNVRDYNAGPDLKTQGKMNIRSRILKTYEYE